jgi:hypothetical protein
MEREEPRVRGNVTPKKNNKKKVGAAFQNTTRDSQPFPAGLPTGYTSKSPRVFIYLFTVLYFTLH